MLVACLDLEGVLLPEIWINIADATNTPELKLTTRDISDYDKLMQYRLKILREKSIKMKKIQEIILTLEPLPGAKDFFKILKERFQIIILSDTFYQFSMPLIKLLDYPTLLCHNLEINDEGFISGYKLRIKDSKKVGVQKIRELNFRTIACGDSYNDITMLKCADKGILFRPPDNVVKEYPQFPTVFDYNSLWQEFIKAERELVG